MQGADSIKDVELLWLEKIVRRRSDKYLFKYNPL
jgi:hypothetical protein